MRRRASPEDFTTPRPDIDSIGGIRVERAAVYPLTLPAHHPGLDAVIRVDVLESDRRPYRRPFTERWRVPLGVLPMRTAATMR